MTEEIWKEYPLNPNYQVSNLGQVKNKQNHLMTPLKGHGGYYFIRTSLKGQKTTNLIHRMVMITFNPIENYQNYNVDHINGIRDDNRLENLRWINQQDNIQLMLINRGILTQELTRIINIYGYEKTLKILQNIH